ncbi:hypothetical protein LX81_03463 [Palleronia aestuarii]|uniref:PAS domain-containing protein n=2 Tax=Palleronia aestuarii TaxID=568105 RepID=A0A2W7NNR5_9RHOB|nr:hypothetical protein LX81_03463 [Palleronia aestuarii]
MKLVEAQLVVAIRHGASARVHAALFTRSSSLMDELEAYVPTSQAELRDMVGFFVRRSSSLQRTGDGDRALEIAMKLTRQYRDRDLPVEADQPYASFQPARPIRSALDPEELAALVSSSPDKIALVDEQFHILGSSESCARSHRSTPIGMMGLHVAEVVGRRAFEQHKRARLVACFDGVPQDFPYEVEDPLGGAQRLQCRMTPITDRTRLLYCALIQFVDTGGSSSAVPEDQDVSFG